MRTEETDRGKGEVDGVEIKIAQLTKLKNGSIKVVYYVDGVRQMFYTDEEQLRIAQINTDIDMSPIVMKYLMKQFGVAVKEEPDETKAYEAMSATIKDKVIA